jgi:hypothetical protein
LNFPVLYPHELVYSAVARSGVRSALASHKQLLDQVYGDRKVVATMDLPCQLESIAHHLERTGRFSLETLLYKHTLLPLYAPFVDEDKRQKAMTLMASKTQGAVHMMLGVSASRLKGHKSFCFCEDCYQQQLSEKGEGYWLREWFLPGLSVCTDHHKQLNFFKEGPGSHRHLYQALYPPELTLVTATKESRSSQSWLALNIKLARMAKALLQLEPVSSPSRAQWSAFYMKLAQAEGFTKGKKVLHEQIYHLFGRYYPRDYLASKGFEIDPKSETNWLKTIFRKHLKSFSYLEHLMVWNVFMTNREVADILKEVRSLEVSDKFAGPDSQALSHREDREFVEFRDGQRQAWSDLAQNHGIKPARGIENGGALYAWLYRHDSFWLLAFNKAHRQSEIEQSSEPRVDLMRRDWQTVRALFKILYQAEAENVKRRMSSRWFLMQLPNIQTLSKNLHKVPLTQAFLERYGETVTEYQLKRVVAYVSHYHREHGQDMHFFKPWKMLRSSGLSKERMTDETECLLRRMGYYF